MITVTLHLKSGQYIDWNYDNDQTDVVDRIPNILNDPACRMIVLQDEETTLHVPIRNVDYVEVERDV